MFDVKELKNGIKILTAPMSGKTITALMIVGTGSKFENRKNNGISHFLEHLFFKGTKKYPTTLSLSSALDSLGAMYNAYTGKEYTGYWIKTDKNKIEKAFQILSDMLLNSKFDSAEIAREKGVIIEELNMYMDNPMMYIEEVFEQCLYGDTPAGWDTIGTKENILNLKRSDFISYLNAQYGPKNTTICLAGNINQAQSADLVKRFFKGAATRERGRTYKEKETIIEIQDKPNVKLHYKKTDQAHLYLGVRSFGYKQREKIIAKIISIILGGSMSSRLFIELRERSGLAYYVQTVSETYSDTGYVATRAGVPVNKLNKAIEIILGQYKKIKNEIVTPKELSRVKDIIKGRLVLGLESSDDLAEWYGHQAVLISALKREFYGEKINEKIVTPEKYLKEIENITSAEIMAVAKKIFINSGLNLAVIGPYQDKTEFEKILVL